MQKLRKNGLPPFGPVGKLLPAVVPPRLVRREIGDHRPEGRAQRTHVGRDRAAARSGRFARRLFGERLAGHVDKPLLRNLRFKQVLDHLLGRIERLQVVQSHRLDGDADDLLLGDARRATLLAEEVFAGFDQSPFRNQPHDFGPRDAHAAGVGLAAHLVESRVERRPGDVGDVHRDLRDAVLLDEPADGLRGRKRSGLHHGISRGILHHPARDGVALADGTPLFAHVEGDGVGAARGGGVQVEIHGDQEVARPDGRGSRAGNPLVEGTRPEIGRGCRVRQFLGQGLVLPGAAHGEVFPFGRKGRSLVAIGRDAQFVGDTPGQRARQFGALRKRDARNRYQRQHVGGPYAGMRPLVAAHVDQFGRPLHPGKSGLDDRFGFADEGHDRAVGRLAGIHVEQFDAPGGLDGRGDLPDHGLIASLAEIGNAFNDSLGHRIVAFKFLYFKDK